MQNQQSDRDAIEEGKDDVEDPWDVDTGLDCEHGEIGYCDKKCARCSHWCDAHELFDERQCLRADCECTGFEEPVER